MKKIIVSLFLILFAGNSFAQTVSNPYPKTISVTGSAEMEVFPDEIFVQVELKEYEKKGQGKINLDKIKSDFLKNARSLGIPDSFVTIASYDAFNNNPWLRKKNKKNELYASVHYQLKIKNSTQLDALVEKMDDDATHNFFIDRTSHSKLAEFRKQLKIQAIKAAKEKARYLTAAIDETLGDVVTINEPVESHTPFYGMNRTANVMMRNSTETLSSTETAPVDFRKIKLKYDVTVVFALK